MGQRMTKKRQSRLACLCNFSYKELMLKQIYKQEGWTAVIAIVHENRIEAGFHLIADANLCPERRASLQNHRERENCERDLPILGKKTILYVDALQGRCPGCRLFHTLRSPL